jgi:hypothetical protein
MCLVVVPFSFIKSIVGIFEDAKALSFLACGLREIAADCSVIRCIHSTMVGGKHSQ